MRDLLIYLAQVSLLIASSYIVYKVAFAIDSHHHIKRFVLLFLVATSFVLPVCRVTIVKEVKVDNVVQTATNSLTYNVQAEQTPQTIALESDTWSIAVVVASIIYFAGVISILLYTFIGVVRVRNIMKKASRKFKQDGVNIILVTGDTNPFSFAGNIIMSESDYNMNADMILRHEAIHIRQHHGIDLIVVKMVSALTWFNPFIWLLCREVTLVHEFAADYGVIKSGINAKKYQYLLISKSLCENRMLPVANNFRTSDLHKRIIYMKRKIFKASTLKLILLLPLITIAVVGFAQTKSNVVYDGTEKEQLYVPVKDVTITATYGSRVNPVTKQEAFHNGIDIVSSSNDTIYAPFSGVVESTLFERELGNVLKITHSDGLETTYAHLASFLVKEGAKVKGGEPVAIIGTTGLSTGKHLHFETRINGELVNPVELFRQGDVLKINVINNK